MSCILKSAASVDDHVIDWLDALAADESLHSIAAAVDPVESGGLVVPQAVIIDTKTSLRLSNGLAGRRYGLEVRAMTSAGRLLVRHLVVRIGGEAVS
jgi:hypothetical protein